MCLNWYTARVPFHPVVVPVVSDQSAALRLVVAVVQVQLPSVTAKVALAPTLATLIAPAASAAPGSQGEQRGGERGGAARAHGPIVPRRRALHRCATTRSDYGPVAIVNCALAVYEPGIAVFESTLSVDFGVQVKVPRP